MPLGSSDFKGNAHSTILDAPSTMAVGDVVKVLFLDDNEWEDSCCVADFVDHMARREV